MSLHRNTAWNILVEPLIKWILEATEDVFNGEVTERIHPYNYNVILIEAEARILRNYNNYISYDTQNALDRAVISTTSRTTGMIRYFEQAQEKASQKRKT